MPKRVYPMRQPEGWKPKFPRWTLELPPNVTEIAIAYIGVQTSDAQSDARVARNKAIDQIEKWLADDPERPDIVERLEVVSGWDVAGTFVFNCYWTSQNASRKILSSVERLDLARIHRSLGSNKEAVGLWRENFRPDLARFETNYAGTDYQPGVAKVVGSKQVEHDRTGYWGAARDRIPASGYDMLDGEETQHAPQLQRSSLRAHLVGSNDRTMAHIRSGQWWENCTDEEAEAYETKLEPALREGLEDIGSRPEDSGDWGVRFLRNVHPAGTKADRPRRETCGAGFFRSLADMETWAKDCPSHHTIYDGAMKHKARFGQSAKFRTWHEVAVLRPGEVDVEYLNCAPRTGSLAFLKLSEKTGDD